MRSHSEQQRGYLYGHASILAEPNLPTNPPARGSATDQTSDFITLPAEEVDVGLRRSPAVYKLLPSIIPRARAVMRTQARTFAFLLCLTEIQIEP